MTVSTTALMNTPLRGSGEGLPAAWQIGLHLVAETGDARVGKGQPVNAMGELVPDLPNQVALPELESVDQAQGVGGLGAGRERAQGSGAAVQ